MEPADPVAPQPPASTQADGESALRELEAFADRQMAHVQQADDAGDDGDAVCSSCAAADAKYRCPSCGARSCSLPCVNAHKSAGDGCGGSHTAAWRKVDQCRMDNYSRLHLLADYRFMEGCSRSVEQAKRDWRKTAAPEDGGQRQQLNKQRRFLMNAGRRRRIRIIFAPPQLDISKCNQSMHDHVSDTILWSLSVAFHKTSPLATYLCHKVAETVTLKTIVKQFVTKASAERMQIALDDSAAFDANDIAAYRSATVDELAVFMRVERCERLCYHRLDVDKPLGAQLRDRLVVEHPAIIVSLAADTADFALWQRRAPKADYEAEGADGPQTADDVGQTTSAVARGRHGRHRGWRGNRGRRGGGHHMHGADVLPPPPLPPDMAAASGPVARPAVVVSTEVNVPQVPVADSDKVDLARLPSLKRAVGVDKLTVPSTEPPLPNAVALAKEKEDLASMQSEKGKSPAQSAKKVKLDDGAEKMRANDYFSIMGGDFELDSD